MLCPFPFTNHNNFVDLYIFLFSYFFTSCMVIKYISCKTSKIQSQLSQYSPPAVSSQSNRHNSTEALTLPPPSVISTAFPHYLFCPICASTNSSRRNLSYFVFEDSIIWDMKSFRTACRLHFQSSIYQQQTAYIRKMEATSLKNTSNHS